jgi:hypothetical protein
LSRKIDIVQILVDTVHLQKCEFDAKIKSEKQKEKAYVKHQDTPQPHPSVP